MDLNCEHIKAEVADGVLVLAIHRPAKKNALTAAMYNALAAGVRQAAERDDVRVLLLEGTADCFTAGNDLDDFRARAEASEPLQTSPALEFVADLTALDKPVVAAVNGLAIGIGTTLLLHCDFVYAGESARLRTPFVDLGLCPEAASSLLLPLIAGPRRAAEMLLMGETLDGRAAAECGLVTRVYPDAELAAAARDQAARLAAKPAGALRASKRLLKRAWAEQVRQVMAVEGDQFGALLRAPEARAILDAFFAGKPG